MAASTPIPSRRDLDVAEHLLGLLSSEVDDIERRVNRLVEPVTAEEYLAMTDDDREALSTSAPRPTFEEAAALLLFATNLRGDGADLIERADKLVAASKHLANDARQPEYPRYRATVSAWHAEHADFYRDGDDA